MTKVFVSYVLKDISGITFIKHSIIDDIWPINTSNDIAILEDKIKSQYDDKHLWLDSIVFFKNLDNQ